MDWKHFASTKPLSAYSIFCGVLEYPESILEELKSGKKFSFENWRIHVNPGDLPSEDIIRGFNNYYYESFVSTVFHDIFSSPKKLNNSGFAEKTARLSLDINSKHTIRVGTKESSPVFEIKFEYLDLFFFPHGIVFYCFKCDLSNFSFDEITLINNYFRNSGVTDDLEFLYKKLSFLEPPVNTRLDANSLSFGNKLKVFSLVELETDISIEDENMLLYDLGACVPIGSASGVNPFFQPSGKYFKELIEKSKISVFNNWSALALFDSFTGLFRKGALNNFNWENGYFNLLYLQSLYVKTYLFKVNRLFYAKGADHQQLEDELYEFNKYFNPSHISYNFLPSIIFKKIRYSLAIDNELNLLKEGIERANRKSKEKRDKTINNILRVITLLAVFSVIWDVSEWLNKIFSGGTTSYNIISGSLTVIVLLIFGIFFLKNYRKNS